MRDLAVQFLACLPTDIRAPEIGEDPDGEDCFEWYEGPRAVVLVSVGTQCSFAAIIGEHQAHGACMPSDLSAIIVLLRMLYAPKPRDPQAPTEER